MTGEPNTERREADLEYAAERYRAALDVGDMQAVAQVIWEAVDDPELDRRISEINREAEKEMYEEWYDEEKPRLHDRLSLAEDVPVYDPEDLIW